MKRIWKVLAGVSCLVMVATIGAACSKEEHQGFGAFSQNGHMLTSYSTRTITAEQVSQMLSGSPLRNAAYIPDSAFDSDSADQSAIDALFEVSNEARMTTHFFAAGSEEMQEEVVQLAGKSFRSDVEKNAVSASAGVVVRNFYMSQSILKAMEKANAEFKTTEEAKYAPFNNLYTYHTDENNDLIVQIHYFTEIPANTMGGGVNCHYRQDVEILYELVPASDLSACYARIKKWQTSLGAVIATIEDSITEGYIYEVEIDWAAKQ